MKNQAQTQAKRLAAEYDDYEEDDESPELMEDYEAEFDAEGEKVDILLSSFALADMSSVNLNVYLSPNAMAISHSLLISSMAMAFHFSMKHSANCISDLGHMFYDTAPL